METQKIINLLNDSSNEEYKFATKKMVCYRQSNSKDKYNQNNSIKFEKVLNQVLVTILMHLF